jgi:hypothetical protein
MPARDVWYAQKRMTEETQNTDAVTVMFHFVQRPVSAFITRFKGNN